MMIRERAQPVYVISIAAGLVEMHPQTLRLYERLGLIHPARTANNIRLYSDEDIERLRQIQRLTQVGVNLAGVEMVLELLERMQAMRRELEEEMHKQQEEMLREIARLRVRASAGGR
jgi:MerR family transcriptional regulator/heat shock protein HspR